VKRLLDRNNGEVGSGDLLALLHDQKKKNKFFGTWTVVECPVFDSATEDRLYWLRCPLVLLHSLKQILE